MGTEPPAIRAAQAHARLLLEVIAQLPPALARSQSTRELHDAVRVAVTALVGRIHALELFLVEASGAIVPSGEPREGVPMLDALWAAGEPLTQQPALLRPTATHGEILSIPITDRSGALGVLVVEAEAGARRFRASDIDDLTMVGIQLTLALQRLHLERRAAAHQRVERDMVLARAIQRSFLPAPPPVAAFGLRVEAHYRPAHDVGGDFYDFVAEADSGAVTFIIGDVAGRGVEAALMMARLSADLRTVLLAEPSPAAVLRRLDEIITGHDDPTSLATALCARIEASGRTHIANAGHPSAIVRSPGGASRTVAEPTGPPLGAGAGWEDDLIMLADGDALFVFTDGLVEAVAGVDRGDPQALYRLVAEGPPELDAACARVLLAAERQRMMRPLDDLTLLAVERLAP